MTYPYTTISPVTTEVECNVNWANTNIVNPLNDLKTLLGSGAAWNQATDLSTFLAVEHNADGTHNLALAEGDIPVLTDYLPVDGSGEMLGSLDMNGYKVIFDADGDSSITSDTDNQFDIEVAGADDFRITANTFTALAGSKLATDTIDETTGDAGVTVDGVLVKDGKVDGIDVGGLITGEFFLPVGAGLPRDTNGCADAVQIESATNKVNQLVCDFDPDAIEYIQWEVFMPANYDGGTITAKFIWQADSASTNSVIWGLQGRSYADGDAVDQAFGTAQVVTDANNAQNDENVSAATSAITLAGTPVAGQRVILQAYRNATDGSDNLAADARLKGVLLTYTKT